MDTPFSASPYNDAEADALATDPLLRRPEHITLIPENTTGCYAHDEQGRPWTTFETVNHSTACAICGMSVSRGWVRGRLGEEMYVCSGHVVLQGCEERPVDEALLNSEF